jgi:hypothetical protein
MRFLCLTLLVTGIVMVLLPVAGLTEFAITMHPYGGIPWSWEFVWLNEWLFVLSGSVFLGGLIAIVFAGVISGRERLSRNPISAADERHTDSAD